MATKLLLSSRVCSGGKCPSPTCWRGAASPSRSPWSWRRTGRWSARPWISSSSSRPTWATGGADVSRWPWLWRWQWGAGAARACGMSSTSSCADRPPRTSATTVSREAGSSWPSVWPSSPRRLASTTTWRATSADTWTRSTTPRVCRNPDKQPMRFLLEQEFRKSCFRKPSSYTMMQDLLIFTQKLLVNFTKLTIRSILNSL